MSEEKAAQSAVSGSFILELTVFVCGAVVMIYEIVGSRLLAPHIGASTYVWTSLIGVILAALSLGYWLGGRAADKKPDVKILASVIFLAGGAIAATILLKELILSFIALSPVILEIKSMLAAALLFGPASVLLGFVPPYAVKLKMSSYAEAGKTVGRLYALSTIGSITGTFLAGFFLIPFVGSTRTLYLVGAALFGVSILLAAFRLTKTNFLILTTFFCGVLFSEAQSFYLEKAYDLHDIDTEYSRVRVFTTIDTQSGRGIRNLAIDPFYTQSRMYLDSDEIVSEYVKFYHLIAHFKPNVQKVLMIGGAGYSFPKDYLKKYPRAEIDVVEIDSQMTRIAERLFRLEKDARLKIFHEDGRIFLNRTEDETYDAVLMDAFGSLFSVPFQLTTVEAARRINRVLKPDGVVVFNVGGALEGNASRFMRAEVATYREVFPQVFIFKVDSDKTDSEIQNLIIVAVKSTQPVSFDNQNGELESLLSRRCCAEFSADEPVLTDELAPVEYYNSFAQSSR